MVSTESVGFTVGIPVGIPVGSLLPTGLNDGVVVLMTAGEYDGKIDEVMVVIDLLGALVVCTMVGVAVIVVGVYVLGVVVGC